jgi:RNA polymerase sigma factor (TIGR02999 family)
MDAGASATRGTVTRLLHEWSGGRPAAADELFPLVYAELRGIAANLLRRERGARTLDTCDLVHEAYLKLLDPRGLGCNERRHFFNIVARAMRQILVDRARRRLAGKRGAGLADTTPGAAAELPVAGPDVVLGLDRLLDRLAQMDPRQAEVVELRVFAGLTIEEVGEALEVSPSTAKRDWRMARAWLASELRPDEGPDEGGGVQR